MSGIYGNNSEDKYFENMLVNSLDDSPITDVVTIDIDLEDHSDFYHLNATVRIIDDSLHEVEVFELFEIDINNNEIEIVCKMKQDEIVDKFYNDIEAAAFDAILY